MRRRLLAESVPLAVGAGSLGAALGFLASRVLEPSGSLLLFGHAVPISFDVATFGLVALAVVLLSIGSDLVLLRDALRSRPTESIRETHAVEPPRSLEVVLRG
jgi:hypothetical protein